MAIIRSWRCSLVRFASRSGQEARRQRAHSPTGSISERLDSRPGGRASKGSRPCTRRLPRTRLATRSSSTTSSGRSRPVDRPCCSRSAGTISSSWPPGLGQWLAISWCCTAACPRRSADPRSQPLRRFRPQRSEPWSRQVGSSVKASTIRGSTRSSSPCRSPGVAPSSSTRADFTASTLVPREHVQEAKPRVSGPGLRSGRRGDRPGPAS